MLGSPDPSRHPFVLVNDMQTFFTSDQHFGHANIIGYTERHRHWSNVDEMDSALIKRWNDVVGHDDFVWVLGDFDMGGKPQSLSLLRHLNGRKGLIIGNHDKPFTGMNQSTETLIDNVKRYQQFGFDVVLNHARVKIASPYAKKQGVWMMLSHFPYTGDGESDGQTRPDRHGAHRLPDVGVPLLHGHTHIADQRVHTSDNGTFQLHVGVDAWDFRPVSETEVYQQYEQWSDHGTKKRSHTA